MDKIRIQILDNVKPKAREEVEELLDELEKETIKNYVKETFKGGPKKHFVTNELKEIFIKFINKEINTKEALEISSLKKSTFFRYLKEFKENEEYKTPHLLAISQ